MPRNFGYYGNNRLKNQTYSRNLYNNNINGKQIINNPQNSNGDSSNFNTYHEGAQTTYTQGLIGKTVSIGGIFGIPPPIPRIPSCPSKTMTVSSPITTQAELDTLQGATIINGGMDINGTTISNLNALSCLQVLNGYFDITNNSNLDSISLPNLETANSGYMFINGNSVNSISFPKLKTVSGDLQINANTVLQSIVFPELLQVGGSIGISNNNVNIISLPNIKSIHNIGSDPALIIQDNGTNGTTLNGFLNLITIGGSSVSMIFLKGTAGSNLKICDTTYNKIITVINNPLRIDELNTLIDAGYCT